MQHTARVRAYGKSELAQLYYPDITAAPARKNFNLELRACRALWLTLKRQGYRPKAHQFTPRQVRTIFQYLGEP